jgi:hypothetical protein
MNISGITFKPQLPVNSSFSVYGEGGMVIVTRNGFEAFDGSPVTGNANYPSFLLGGGMKYYINKNWALILSMVWTPENRKAKQPARSFYSTGFSYKLLPLSQEKIDKVARAGYIHPKQMVQVGVTSNILGYGVNNLLAEHYIPVFWGGEAKVARGLAVGYQRNFFMELKCLRLTGELMYHSVRAMKIRRISSPCHFIQC